MESAPQRPTAGRAAPQPGGSDLDGRLLALREAVGLARGRVEPATVAAADAVVQRAGTRLGLGLETTVIALAGPTGAGKSSLFNALAGDELVPSGVRRPTTSTVTAAVWGRVEAALLEWLQTATRHVIDDAADASGGVVVLDLPDYDSVEAGHRLEVERVLDLADLLVWVVDPQKYADAALHDRYLKRLNGHGEAMIAVLNQSDRLDDRALAACRDDLERLLAQDGLPGMPVFAASAITGDGMHEVRGEIRRRVEARTAVVARLAADVRAAASRLGEGCAARPGAGRAPAKLARAGSALVDAAREGAAGGAVSRGDRAQLVDALADAAGVPLVVQAVAGGHRRSGRLATGWPYARWIGRLRPDPLTRLRLLSRAGPETHTSVPRATPVQRAQVASAARTLAAHASAGLPDPWPRLVRDAAGAREQEAPALLDRVVARADVHPRRPRWWRAAAAAQRVLAAVAAAGALWLLALAVLGYLQLGDVLPTPELGTLPLPTLLLAGGVVGGIALALIARYANGVGAARRARRAAKVLRDGVEAAAQELVVGPVEAELAARDALCAAVARACAGR